MNTFSVYRKLFRHTNTQAIHMYITRKERELERGGSIRIDEMAHVHKQASKDQKRFGTKSTLSKMRIKDSGESHEKTGKIPMILNLAPCRRGQHTQYKTQQITQQQTNKFADSLQVMVVVASNQPIESY